MKILYLDLVFLVNLLADYLLCLSAARLCGLQLKRLRYLLAALLGAVSGLMAALPRLSFLRAPPGILGVGLLMGLVAFGGEARPLRGILSLLACTAAFGGALYALTLMGGGPPVLSLRVLVIAFLLCYGALKLLSRFRSRWDGRQKARICLRLAGREARFSALLDSGNNARDPVSGAGILVASPEALRPILQEYTEFFAALQPVELAEAAAGVPMLAGRIRLVPYRSLGGGGLLPAFRPDCLSVDGQETTALLVAVSPEARGDGFEAIL